ncbi:MAG: fimbrillin family protein [Phocaeicola sp.]
MENPKTNGIISLEAQIGIPTVKLRYVNSNEVESTFTENDKIGLFRDDESVIGWEFKSNNWESEEVMYWNNADVAHNFYAYYPFLESERNPRTAIIMPTLKNQTGNLTDISKHDFLVSKLLNRKFTDGSTISFSSENSFKHVSSLVKLIFKAGGNLEGATLTSIELSGDMLSSTTTYSFDAAEGSQLVFEGELAYTTITASGLNVDMNDDRVFYFVANEYANATRPISLILGYTINDSEKTIIVDFPETKFISGKLHPYAISIMNGAINVTGSAIEDWKNDVGLVEIVVDGTE